MKQSHQRLSLKKLQHRLLRLQSAAFIKIVLAGEEGDLDSQSEKITKEKIIKFRGIVLKLFDSKLVKHNQVGFEKIKQAGWKIIIEADSVDQQDCVSEQRSRSKSKYLSRQSTMSLTEISVQPPQSPSFPLSIIQPNLISSKQNYEVNGIFSTMSQICQSSKAEDKTSRSMNQMKKNKKRAIILKKLQNLQLCVDYLHFSSQDNYIQYR